MAEHSLRPAFSRPLPSEREARRFFLSYQLIKKLAIIISLTRAKLNREVKAMKEKKKEKIVVDPNGMYTGRPIDPDERPIQDADDL